MPDLRTPHTVSAPTAMPRPQPPARRARALAAGALAASPLPVAAIVLWAGAGDLSAAGVFAVAAGAILLSWAVMRQVTRAHARRLLCARTSAPLVASQAACRPPARHGTPLTRERRTVAADPCTRRRCRPLFVSRLDRDAGCRAASRRLDRRTARRRTRP